MGQTEVSFSQGMGYALMSIPERRSEEVWPYGLASTGFEALAVGVTQPRPRVREAQNGQTSISSVVITPESSETSVERTKTQAALIGTDKLILRVVSALSER